jgi:hypothetical protein
MSLRFLCAADITVRYIAAATKPLGWNKTGIDPTTVARVLWLKAHPLPSVTGRTGSKLRADPI